MSKKKICLFFPNLAGGGAEKVMVQLANEMAELGHDVDMVLVSKAGPYLSMVSDKVNIVSLNKSGVLNSLPNFVGYIRKNKPYAILSALKHANVIAVIASKLANVKSKIFVSEHNNLSMTNKNRLSFKDRVVLAAMSVTYRLADGVIAVSNGVADDLSSVIKLPRNKITVIYNPIISAELLQKSNEPLNHPWIHSDIPIILGVGRLTPQKNFTLLINAFAKIKNTHNCRLVILGEGELREDLDSLVNDLKLSHDVYMPGFVSNPFNWMKHANVFVLSSSWEGFGNVIVEALACGTQVVSVDCPSGPREILDDGRWGMLVPIDDIDEMALAVKDVLQRVGLPKGIDDHLTRFASAAIGEKYLNALMK